MVQTLTLNALAAGAAAAIVGFLVARLSAPHIISFLRKRGITRRDAHKPGKPIVAHSGGIIIAASMFAAYLAALLVYHKASITVQMTTIIASALICFLVGLYDDIKILGGKEKTLLTILSIIPIIAAYFFFPTIVSLGRPVIPLIGRIRLTIVYWAILPLAVAGPANLVNMLDIYNGVTPGMMLVAAAALLASSLILSSDLLFISSLMLIATLLAYYPFNAYPSKVFNGDSGSLFLGGFLGALAVVGKIEFIVLTLLIPHLINGIMVLVSFGGFKEHRQVKGRPIEVKDGVLMASHDPNAPWSLTRFILYIGGPAHEKELSHFYILLELVPAILAVITALLMRVYV